ncbi:hypothetical protein CN122_14755 [Sinorhizobium meliloti]|nr:hypothetical protein CN122_14755 [Sinorhizobium meliloti]
MGDAELGRAAPIRADVRIAALIPEHEFEGDGKSFPSHVSHLVCWNQKTRSNGGWTQSLLCG